MSAHRGIILKQAMAMEKVLVTVLEDLLSVWLMRLSGSKGLPLRMRLISSPGRSNISQPALCPLPLCQRRPAKRLNHKLSASERLHLSKGQ